MNNIEEEIDKVYNILNEEYMSEQPHNTKETRYDNIQRMIKYLDENVVGDVYGFMVYCDEEINTPTVIDNNTMVTRVQWRNDKYDGVNSIDLTFGK